jgi:hypothetical protein
MACLFCRFWQPIEPEDHRLAREAGTDTCTRKWNHAGALHYVLSHRKYLEGACLRTPEPKTSRANDVCGQIELATTGELWSPPTPQFVKPGENLRDWANAAGACSVCE